MAAASIAARATECIVAAAMRTRTPSLHLPMKKSRRAAPSRSVQRVLCRAVLLNPELFATVTAFQHGIFEDLVFFVREWKGMVTSRFGNAPFVLPERYFKSYDRKTFHLSFLCLDPASIDAAPLHLSIFEGDAARVNRWLACKPQWLTHRALDCAASHGHLHLVLLLHDRGAAASPTAMDLAALGGHLGIVQFLHGARHEGCTFHALDHAARAGHLAVVRFLHEHVHAAATHRAMDAAATHGFLDVVRFLHTHRHEGCSTAAMDAAASAGFLAIVEFLHWHRTEGCTSAALDGAATHGHMEVVQFLHIHRHEGGTAAAMDGAARAGRLDMLRWLHEQREEGCSTDAMDDAAKHGHLEVVRWLHEARGAGCTAEGLQDTEEAGHMTIAAFLRAHCCVVRYTAPLPLMMESSDSEGEALRWWRGAVVDDDDEW
ncbi:Aste57867_9762 [Aphanomyces stellatus]|uniref:Aste57867_9762 protein n=1 Tax=Aphanomyces stellatus TaxID=120398 RepID=A0A485KNP8_9STRA|nr:hypothetical protein As57867_009723 [Aphanomyces stellatus]VFT86641.1 Aste57867_9762 [Aphanomyces stellatus]